MSLEEKYDPSKISKENKELKRSSLKTKRSMGIKKI
jgi:hypothetical protein